MIIQNPEQLNKLREGGKILAQIIQTLAKAVKPKVSAFDLNRIAEQEIKKFGVESSFKNYKSHKSDPVFPASLCVSVNNEVVHGIPSKDKILKEGDIVGLDLGIWHKGLCTDAAITVGVGKIGKTEKELLLAAQRALEDAINEVRADAMTGDLGFAMQSAAKKFGFSTVRELVGHGVGKSVHEEPEIPCYGNRGSGEKLVEGMVIAIEPMVNEGSWKVIMDKDGWTIRTYDQGLSAHFEHTVVVTKDGCEILTQT